MTNMSVLFVLIGISLIVALAFLASCMWALRNGQYDDEDTPAKRMLFDDAPTNKTTTNK